MFNQLVGFIMVLEPQYYDLVILRLEKYKTGIANDKMVLYSITI